MTTDAQKELCEKLDAPSYTADDYMVMTEAANEIRYLAARLATLEQSARRTTPDRDAVIEQCAKLVENEYGLMSVADHVRSLKAAPTSDKGGA